MDIKTKRLYIFGFIGLLASVGVGIGEYLLHNTPGGVGYDGEQFDFFKYVDLSRLTLGHFVAISFAPLYIIGYYHFFLVFKDKNPRSALGILVLGVVAFMIGGMWISSRAQLGYLMHFIEDNPSDNSLKSLVEVYNNHLEILVQSLRLWITGISILFVIPILKGRTFYPKWMAIFNPIFLLILIKLIYNVAPSVGHLIGPIAMNVVHFIIFGMSLLLLRSMDFE